MDISLIRFSHIETEGKRVLDTQMWILKGRLLTKRKTKLHCDRNKLLGAFRHLELITHITNHYVNPVFSSYIKAFVHFFKGTVQLNVEFSSNRTKDFIGFLVYFVNSKAVFRSGIVKLI